MIAARGRSGSPMSAISSPPNWQPTISSAWPGTWTPPAPSRSTVSSKAGPPKISTRRRPARLRGILRDYHRLNFDRRPEHLQYYLPGEKARPSPLSMAQADARLANFTAMTAAAATLEPAIPADRRDAFFELVTYPVAASAAANHRFFAAEAHDRLRDTDQAQALQRGAAAHGADDRLRTLTHHYNHSIAGGKWRGMMAVEPADGQWRSYRLIPPLLPAPDAPVRSATPPAIAPPPSAPLLTPRDFIAGPGWRHGDGLGRHGKYPQPHRPARHGERDHHAAPQATGARSSTSCPPMPTRTATRCASPWPLTASPTPSLRRARPATVHGRRRCWTIASHWPCPPGWPVAPIA